MCIRKGCKRVRTYNYDGLHAEYCADHKTDDMINTRHEKCEECRYQASFGFLTENKRVRCRMHKVEGMINLKHKNIKCDGDGCGSCASPNHNGYCSKKCFISNNLQEYIYNETDGILYKEYLIFKHLKETYPDHNIIWDKIYSCNYRPDYRISFDGFTIIIEADEYQHHGYSNETERIELMYHNVMEPLFVIRFNTDAYRHSGKIVRSPFSYNILKDTVEWTRRLASLTDAINKCIDCAFERDCVASSALPNVGYPDTYEIIRLFYDAA